MRKGGSYVVRDIGTIERADADPPAKAEAKRDTPRARDAGRKTPPAKGGGKKKEK